VSCVRLAGGTTAACDGGGRTRRGGYGAASRGVRALDACPGRLVESACHGGSDGDVPRQ